MSIYWNSIAFVLWALLWLTLKALQRYFEENTIYDNIIYDIKMKDINYQIAWMGQTTSYKKLSHL